MTRAVTEDGPSAAEENAEILESNSVCLVLMLYLTARKDVLGVSNKLS